MVATAQKHKVLVIDDSFMVRKSLVDQLSGPRFEVYEANDGPTGLDQAAKINPDVILLDYVMPGMNGYEVYQALRAQAQFTNTPIIVISSSREEVIKKFGQPFVGFDFLPKAFTREQLEERIDAVLPVRESGVKLPSVNYSEVQNSVNQRIDQLEARLTPNFDDLLRRLERLESAVNATGGHALEAKLDQLSQRIVETLQHQSPTLVLEKLSALERHFEETSTPKDRTDEVLSRINELQSPPQTDRTDEVLGRLGYLTDRLGQGDRTDEVLSRLNSLEQRLPSSGIDRTEEVLGRLGRLDERLNHDRTNEVLDRLNQLQYSLPSTPTDRTDEVLGRLGRLEDRINQTKGDRTDEVLSRLNQLPSLPPDRTGEVLLKLDQFNRGLEDLKDNNETKEISFDPVLSRLAGLEDKIAKMSTSPSAPATEGGTPGWLLYAILLVSLVSVLVGAVR